LQTDAFERSVHRSAPPNTLRLSMRGHGFTTVALGWLRCNLRDPRTSCLAVCMALNAGSHQSGTFLVDLHPNLQSLLGDHEWVTMQVKGGVEKQKVILKNAAALLSGR
jgi:hypothetical protein